MKKESQNLGVRKACPECKKLFLKAGNILGDGSTKVTLNQMCPHCKTQITIEVGHKNYIKVYKTPTIIVLAVLITISIVLSIANNIQMASLTENNYVQYQQ